MKDYGQSLLNNKYKTNNLRIVGFEVSTAVVMKGIIFWQAATCLLAGSC
jgi:hypothetical protein